jgi:hypothetical protein
MDQITEEELSPVLFSDLPIDWEQLRVQKDTLILHSLNVQDVSVVEKIQGVVHLIDALQDAAVYSGYKTEEEVFGKRTT